MKPYYEHDGITIFHGEALNVLTALDGIELAAVLADPPYSSGGLFRSDRSIDPGIKYRGWSQDATGHSITPAKDYGSFSGDSRDQRSYILWMSLWLSQVWRLAIPTAQCFIFTDWRQIPSTTDALQSGGLTWRGLLVWDKGVGRPMKGRFRNHLEYVAWGSHGSMPPPDDIYPSTLLRHPTVGAAEREHVTQKPESLIKELLSITPPGTVLDPFMGSGTTLRAAKDLGRKAIGVEICEAYCEIAAKRLAQGVLDFQEAI